MIEHQGIVRAIHGQQAVVAVATGGCNSCEHQGGCAMGRFAAGRPETTLTLAAPPGLAVGNTVTLSLPESRAQIGLLAGYLFPALTLVAGSGLGSGIFNSDAAAALGAIAGLLFGLMLTSLFPQLAPTPRLTPAPVLPTTTTDPLTLPGAPS